MIEEHHRVNGSNYQNYLNQNVRIIGQMLERDSNYCTIQSTDGKNIHIILNEKSQINRIETQWIEVLGRVQPDFSILEKITYGIYSEVPIDCQIWNEAIPLMERFNQLF